MFTERRLTEVYEAARVEPLDAGSRYVFVSDCHRGVGSPSDEFSRNEIVYLHALGEYYRDGFVYVEVGDGDELWEHPRLQHVRGAHPEAFDALKRFCDAGRLIVLWGNHNIQLRDPGYVAKHCHACYDERTEEVGDLLVGLRPVEALVLRDAERGCDLLVVHGHQGDAANDQFWFLTMTTVRVFWRHLHAFGVRNPTSPARNALKRHKIERNYSKWIARHRTALVCGHTHRFRYPGPADPPYFNTGSCIYPTGMTALEIADGEIRLVEWRTVADESGVLRVVRRVIGGPDGLDRLCVR